MEPVTAERLRDVLLEAVDEFHRAESVDSDVRSKHDGSPVTGVDLAIDGFLRRRLQQLAPSAQWLSEESSDGGAGLSADATWVVDPLDGTKEYVLGIPEFAVSVAFVDAGSIRAGGVVNPRDGLGAATGTDGSWLSWPASAGDPHPAAPTLMHAVASVSRTEWQDGVVLPYVDLVGAVHPVGSAAYKLLRVACGMEDLTFSVQPKQIWDICGGRALLQARGMVLRCLEPATDGCHPCDLMIRGGFVAGPPTLAETLASLIRERLKHRNEGRTIAGGRGADAL